MDECEAASHDDDDRQTPTDEEPVTEPETVQVEPEPVPEPVLEPVADETAAATPLHDQTIAESETDARPQQPEPAQVPVEIVPTEEVPEAVPAQDVESVAAQVAVVPDDNVALEVEDKHQPDVDVKDPARGHSEGGKVFIVTVWPFK